MTKVTDLPRGWTLYASDDCHGISMMPVFVHRDGRRRHALEVATRPEAPEVFREIKRQLDIADKRRKLDDFSFRGLDMGKFSLEMSLKLVQRFDKGLLETGVSAHGV